jgi:hypothetical protein
MIYNVVTATSTEGQALCKNIRVGFQCSMEVTCGFVKLGVEGGHR